MITRPATRAFASALLAIVIACGTCVPVLVLAQDWDVVIANGRVIDPESGLDAVRNIGIRSGRIEAVTTESLDSATVLDATGLIVAPGFIDLHDHGQNAENYRVKAMDGVTTTLELEVGARNVDTWYAQRAGRALINYGASIGQIGARNAVFNDPGPFLPIAAGASAVATQAQIDAMQSILRQGLDSGALGVGIGIQYTPGATRWEILEMFRVAAEYGAPVFVHVRSYGTKEPGSSVESILEVIGDAAVTGAPLHIVHLNSVSLESTPQTLQIVREARDRGIDVTAEAYPYSAGMTQIQSAVLDQYEGAPDSVLENLQWVATGERLNTARFRRYREQGGWVILHLNTPEMEAMAVTSPLTTIASDGALTQGTGHPRQAGTFSRVLAHYVRETGQLSLPDAIRKMTLMPAQRLETWAPEFRNKGRIRVGADADIVVFDADRVRDHSTYENPAAVSEGFRWVLVNGIRVVDNGSLVEAGFPGRPARAPRR